MLKRKDSKEKERDLDSPSDTEQAPVNRKLKYL